MLNDYVEISGEDYRIEWNFNAIAHFTNETGTKFSEIDNIGNWGADMMLKFIHAALVEGERLDGKKFPFDLETFGAMIQVTNLPVFFEIFKSQIAGQTAEIKAKKKESNPAVRQP